MDNPFRIWGKKDKKFLEPSFCALTGDGQILRGIVNWFPENNKEYIVQLNSGYKDKYERKIFVGDYVEIRWSNGFSWGTGNISGEVILKKGAFGVKDCKGKFTAFNSLTPTSKSDSISNYITIKGNVCENPELLGKELAK